MEEDYDLLVGTEAYDSFDELDVDDLEVPDQELIDMDNIDLTTAQLGTDQVNQDLEDLENDMLASTVHFDETFDTDQLIEVRNEDIIEPPLTTMPSQAIVDAVAAKLNTISKYEFTRIIGERYAQICGGAIPLVDQAKDPMILQVIGELRNGTCPLTIQKGTQSVPVNNMLGVSYYIDVFWDEIQQVVASESLN